MCYGFVWDFLDSSDVDLLDIDLSDTDFDLK